MMIAAAPEHMPASPRPPRPAGRNETWLKKRQDFLNVQRARKAVRRLLVLQARDRRDGSPATRFGLTVSRKVGNAVERNRVRRRLRAALNDLSPLYAQVGHDYVVVGRRAALAAPFAAIVDDLSAAFHAIHRAGARMTETPVRNRRDG